MSEVIEINEIEDLRAYASFWNRLHAKTPQATFFQTLPWLETYWKFFGHGKKLRVLLVQVDCQIKGILPLVEQTERTKAGPVRILTYPLDGWGPFYGPVGSDQAATLYAAMQYLQATPRSWDLIDLRYVDPIVDRGRIFNTMRCHGMSPNVLPWNPSYAIQLPDNFEEFISTRSSKFRATIRRTLRKAEEAGVISARYRPTPCPTDNAEPNFALYDECVLLARRTWQACSTTGTTLSHPEAADYFRECFVQASRLGMIDIMTLKHEDRMIAFSYNFHHQGNLLGLRMGYERDSKQLTPGTVMMSHQIRDSIQRGDQLIDLGPEHLEIKSRWINRTLESQRVCHYSRLSLSANVLRMGHWWKYHRNVA